MSAQALPSVARGPGAADPVPPPLLCTATGRATRV